MLPSVFLERLARIIPAEQLPSVLQTFALKRDASIRVNPLKGNCEELIKVLSDQNIDAVSVLWSKDAFLLRGIESTVVSRWDLSSQGKIYLQSASSMLPAVVLDPQPGEGVLDLCAAPGSKTSQMAAMMQNQGKIVAVEAIRERFYRLKSVMTLLGVQIVEAKCLDGRRFRAEADFLFDRILVDAPCSSEGRFKTYDKKTIGYWSPRKIKEMVQKQRGLLLNACRLLKPGGVLVYSTCTFAPEENEGVVSWVLGKMGEHALEVEAISIPGIETYPAILQWGDAKPYDPRTAVCCRVLPTSTMEGFFMTKIVKRA